MIKSAWTPEVRRIERDANDARRDARDARATPTSRHPHRLRLVTTPGDVVVTAREIVAATRRCRARGDAARARVTYELFADACARGRRVDAVARDARRRARAARGSYRQRNRPPTASGRAWMRLARARRRDRGLTNAPSHRGHRRMSC